MKRSQLREQVFQLLFRVEFHPEEDMNEQEVLFSEWSDTPLSEKDALYVRQKYEHVSIFRRLTY